MNLSRAQLRTLALASLGGALEFYDFVIFVFFATTMGTLFFPADMPEWMRLVQTFGIFAAGYLARPLGGVVLAHFGDLRGRKRMFMLSILMMAVPTLLMGLLPTYASVGALAPVLLLLLRLLQGAAIGGEAPGAWVFVSEHVSPRHRSLACGTLSAGLLAGILVGALVAAGIGAALSDAQLLDWGWRVPFVVGGVFGLGAMYVRRRLHETPVFAELRERRALAAELPLKAVLRDHLPAVALSMLLTWLLTAVVVVAILLMPTLLQRGGVAREAALVANSLAIACAMLGNLAAGALGDRYGEGRALAAWSLLMGVAFWIFYTTVGSHPARLYPMYALVGFGVGLTALVPSIAVAAFPAQVRFSGLSFSYNVAYAICGGATPVAITLLLRNHPLAPAQYLAAMAVVGCALGLWVDKKSGPKPAFS
ncbi:MAG TPA: MFS transporter [Rhodanobacter sp.]|nr:MFS transporter [Rhodanobacter sp.]